MAYSETVSRRLVSDRRAYLGDYWVADFLVRPREGFVETPAGDRLRLEPKALEVLTCLADRQGRTVTKRALFDRVWSDVEVTDHVLTRCISQLRKAFGDDGRKQTVIQTVYKLGYRLLPEVSPAPSPEQSPEATDSPRIGSDGREVLESLGYRQILSASQDHIYIFDRDCRYLFANPNGARAVGLSSEDMEGKHWRDLGLVAEILEPFEALLRRCFRHGEAFLERVSYPTVFGERLYEYSLDPVRAADGSTVAVLAVVRDITGRRPSEFPGPRAPIRNRRV